MKVAIDFTPIIKERYTGFYTYGWNLLRAMQKLDNCPDFSLFYFNRYDDRAKEIKEKLNDFFLLAPTKVKLRWLQKIWNIMPYPPLQKFTGDFDVYHSIFQLMPPTKGKPKVMTVYDLRRFALPDSYKTSKTEQFKKAINEVDHIISISKSTSEDLVNIFKIKREKISVVHLAHDNDVFFMNSERVEKAKEFLKDSFNCDSKFLTTISASDKRKNCSNTIKAFLKSSISDDYKLVILGYFPKNDEELNLLLENENVKKKIFMTGPVEDINAFIAASVCLVFPTLYEGFGMPIINAQEMGVPVITSNVSSMPEVGGDAVLLVDPRCVDSISTAISSIINNDKLRNDLILKGRVNSSRFSWEKTAAQTVDVYKKII